MSYSLDLRQRVVDAVQKAGQAKEEVAERFLVSMATINRWLKRDCLQADKPGPTTSHRINREELKALVEKEPDFYLDEYAAILNSKRSTVAYNLQALKLSRKKNHAVLRAKRGKAKTI